MIVGLSLPEKEEPFGKLAVRQAQAGLLTLCSPALSFAGEGGTGGISGELAGFFPILRLSGEGQLRLLSESSATYEEIIRAEGQSEYTKGQGEDFDTPESSAGRVEVEAGGELTGLLQEENRRAQQSPGEERQVSQNEAPGEETAPKETPSLPVPDKAEQYQWEYYEKYDALVKEFYAVDASTAADESLLNLDALLSPDLSIEKRSDDQPQILIYHTHSQEAFADSVPGDETTTILGVGEVLAQLLREQYGYNVMHHMGKYDVEKRDYAYSNSLPALEELLAQYPTIEVVIDLHRDEVAEGTRLVTEIEGRPTARFMFFNGLSRTKKHGAIDYLPNENIADNLAFSFQLQVLCNEYYPGLTRRIYLKGYRYNMHLKPRYLLVEMGAQTNTYGECYNACIPLARMLDLELAGNNSSAGRE
ncbi:MAG: stage II sporulation protein P [Eubacteriales bacterium]|nr:stage II sporulation protein P [Eubacteriales bacterium]